MPLRDFDRVRERIVLRLEVRHVVRFTLAMLALAGGCFYAGFRVGQDAMPAPVRKPAIAQASRVTVAPQVVAVAPALPTEPVVPRPLAPVPQPLAPAPDAVLHALTAQEATSPGERIVPPDPQPEPAAEVVAAPQIAKAEPTPPEAATPGRATPEPAAPEPAKAPGVQNVATVAAVQLPRTKAAPPPAARKLPPAQPIQLTQAWPGLGLWRATPATPVHPQLRPKPAVARVAPAAPAQPSTPHGVAGERYVIQVKAFRNESEAQAFQAQLLGKGHRATLSTIEVPGKGTFYRIRLGPFPTVDLAKAAQRKFEQAEGHATILLVVGGSTQASTTP